MAMALPSFFGWFAPVPMPARSTETAFRNRREAAEFVRRVRNQNGGPNAALRDMYREYRSIRANAELENQPSEGDRLSV